MSSSVTILGDIPDDQRVKDALDKAQGKDLEQTAAEAILGTAEALEKYGIKMRKVNLFHTAMLSSIATLGELDAAHQGFVLLWTLCAPLKDIYGVIEQAKKGGISVLMAAAHEWFDSSGFPQDVTQEAMNLIVKTWALASKISPKGSDEQAEGTIKKNQIPGSS